MNAGKLTCRRTDEYDTHCHTLHCVDYEKRIFDSFQKKECRTPQGWVKYWDGNAQANYWYNWDTGEATWIPKGGRKRSIRRRQRRTNRFSKKRK